MKTVIPTYMISVNTLALLPAKQIDFDTIVIKEEEIKHVRKPPFDLIKRACYDDWSNYEGKRRAVVYHTNFTQKVPIPVHIRKGIYFFPTHSPNNIDNSWIAYQHILSIEKAPEHQAGNHAQSIIHFKNKQKLFVNVSLHTLKTQMQRTFECMFRIEGMKGLR